MLQSQAVNVDYFRLATHVRYTVTTTVVTSVSAPCTAGQHFDIVENMCKACERGTYQSKERTFQCDKCPLGQTTLGVEHTNVAACVSEYHKYQ